MVIDGGGVTDYHFLHPHLAVIIFEDISQEDGFKNDKDYDGECKSILKVWNIEKSPQCPLYSIDIEKMGSEGNPNYYLVVGHPNY